MNSDLLVIWNGKKKRFASVEVMTIQLGVEEPDEIEIATLKRLSARGEFSHACLDPYASEINGENSMMFASSAENLEEMKSQRYDET